MPAKTSTVYINGGASGQMRLENVMGYEVLDLKAGTYHKFLFAGDMVVYLNDFGIRSVTVVPSGTREFDIPRL